MVPNLKEAYYNELDRRKFGLRFPVAHLDGHAGLIFATFDPEAPPLLEYLGEMAWAPEHGFSIGSSWQGRDFPRALSKWIIPCNWKFPAENLGGDEVITFDGRIFRQSRPASTRRRPRDQNPPATWPRPVTRHVLMLIGPSDLMVSSPHSFKTMSGKFSRKRNDATARAATVKKATPARSFRISLTSVADQERSASGIRAVPRPHRGLVLGLL